MYTFYSTRKYNVSIAEFNNRFLVAIYDKTGEEFVLLSRGFGKTDRAAVKQAREGLK